MNNQKLKEEYEAGESVRDLCKKYNSYPSKIHSILKTIPVSSSTKVSIRFQRLPNTY